MLIKFSMENVHAYVLYHLNAIYIYIYIFLGNNIFQSTWSELRTLKLASSNETKNEGEIQLNTSKRVRTLLRILIPFKICRKF